MTTAKKYLRRPLEFATAGNYPAGGNAWNGQPRLYSPTAIELASGNTPDTPIPAEAVNYLEQIKGDMLTVQNFEAMTRWRRANVNGTTNAIGQHLLALAPQGGVGLPAVNPQLIAVFGTLASNSHTLFMLSPDGSAFSGGGDPGYAAYSAIGADPFGVAFGGLTAVATCKSVDYNSAVTTFTPGNTGVVTAAHYGAGKYLIAADNHIYYSSSLAGGWASVAIGSAGDTVQEIVDNGDLAAGVVPTVLVLIQAVSFNGHRFALYSTDDGLTWTSGHDFGAVNLSVTWSPAWGLFVIIDATNAGFWTSPDGATWTKQKTIGATMNTTAGAQALAACGQCVAQIVNRAIGGGTYQQGLAYTFDLGATWQEIYFGEIVINRPIRCVKQINGRLVACDDYNVYVSGLLESPANLYLGS